MSDNNVKGCFDSDVMCDYLQEHKHMKRESVCFSGQSDDVDSSVLDIIDATENMYEVCNQFMRKTIGLTDIIFSLCDNYKVKFCEVDSDWDIGDNQDVDCWSPNANNVFGESGIYNLDMRPYYGEMVDHIIGLQQSLVVIHKILLYFASESSDVRKVLALRYGDLYSDKQ